MLQVGRRRARFARAGRATAPRGCPPGLSAPRPRVPRPPGAVWGALAVGLLVVPRERVLAHPRRRRLYELVRTHPGIHLREIARQESLGLGVLRFHLRRLGRAGFLTSRRTGRRRIFFADGYRGPEGRSRRERVLEEIHRSPGVTQSELARKLGCSKMLVHYHVRRLLDARDVIARRDASSVHLFLQRGEHRPSPVPRGLGPRGYWGR